MSPLQKAEYERLLSDTRQSFTEPLNALEASERMGLLARLTRLRQACCDPGLLPWQSCDSSHSGKLNVLMERLSELMERGHRVVVFSQFTQLLNRAQSRFTVELPAAQSYRLDGRTTDRKKPVEAFQSSDEPAVFFVSLKAGGTGLTLNNADYVFLLDPWWNPAVERQAIDRVHRMGQKKAVFVFRMIAPETVETRIEAMKQQKRLQFENLVAGMGSAETSFLSTFKHLDELLG
jgi:SNF2 family DNA or RNA helicase